MGSTPIHFAKSLTIIGRQLDLLSSSNASVISTKKTMTSAVNTSPIASAPAGAIVIDSSMVIAAGEYVGQRLAIDWIAAGEDCGQSDVVQSRVRLPDAQPAENGCGA